MSTGTADEAAGTTKPSSSIHSDSVMAVARKDFQDAVRSYLFWGLSAFFFTIMVGVTGAISYFNEDIAAEGATTDMLILLTMQITLWLIPVVALVLGWKAIAGERESGSIKILLSLPHSRKDVLLGTLLGRVGVLSLSLVVGFTLAAVVVAALLGGFDVADYVGLLAMSILYGTAYTSMAVSLSSMTRSSTVAGAAMIGVFGLFYGVWNTLNRAYELLAARDVPGFEMVEYTIQAQGQEIPASRPADWALFVINAEPGAAYQQTLSLVTDIGAIEQRLAVQDQMFDGDVPFFFEDWFGLVMLLAWIFVPLLIALWRFDRVDI